MYIFFIEIITFFCATVLMPIENSYGSCLSWFFSFHINLFDLWWNCSDVLYSVKLRRFFNESSSQKTFSTLRNIPYTWETRDICSRFWRSELFAIFYCSWPSPDRFQTVFFKPKSPEKQIQGDTTSLWNSWCGKGPQGFSFSTLLTN